jgi:uncharacterized protein YndB with AHSA1/START domain
VGGSSLSVSIGCRQHPEAIEKVIEPLRLSIEVTCPIEDAFAIWTSETTRWWPLTHTVSGEDGLQVFFEGRVGGRIFERTREGNEFDWGKVTLWDPPRRLRYLWHLRQDKANPTTVEISFVDLRNSGTRVDIEHSGWERLGERGEADRDANGAGWGGLFPYYTAACSVSSQ